MKRWIHASSTKVTASNILPNKTIQKGMMWYSDGFVITVTKVSPDHKTCQLSESWTSEDDEGLREDTYTYRIEKSDGEERAYNPEYPESGYYATNALNYPHDYDSDDDLDAEDYEEHDYTPSATAGDYSPSNPWDAPGMSIRDFI